MENATVGVVTQPIQGRRIEQPNGSEGLLPHRQVEIAGDDGGRGLRRTGEIPMRLSAVSLLALLLAFIPRQNVVAQKSVAVFLTCSGTRHLAAITPEIKDLAPVQQSFTLSIDDIARTVNGHTAAFSDHWISFDEKFKTGLNDTREVSGTYRINRLTGEYFVEGWEKIDLAGKDVTWRVDGRGRCETAKPRF